MYDVSSQQNTTNAYTIYHKLLLVSFYKIYFKIYQLLIIIPADTIIRLSWFVQRFVWLSCIVCFECLFRGIVFRVSCFVCFMCVGLITLHVSGGVSVCENQAKWGKSETCMSKSHRSDNVIPLKDTSSIWKDQHLISATLALRRNCSIES